MTKPLSEYARVALLQAGDSEANAQPVNGRVAGAAAAMTRGTNPKLARTDNGHAYLYWRTAAGNAALAPRTV